ncbi:MAG: family Na+-dependent transporter, partial [Chlamydiales bacterium]|nr:family Na+-dependent transporter [Chlamydiales bacterium]
MRSHWKSRFGFIMATSGAAIGLGNIQRFPYLVAEEGGAAFVFIYILAVLLLGLPLLLVELSLGRFAKKNAVDSIKAIR